MRLKDDMHALRASLEKYAREYYRMGKRLHHARPRHEGRPGQL